MAVILKQRTFVQVKIGLEGGGSNFCKIVNKQLNNVMSTKFWINTKNPTTYLQNTVSIRNLRNFSVKGLMDFL